MYARDYMYIYIYVYIYMHGTYAHICIGMCIHDISLSIYIERYRYIFVYLYFFVYDMSDCDFILLSPLETLKTFVPPPPPGYVNVSWEIIIPELFYQSPHVRNSLRF